MVEHTKTIRRQLPTKCLSVFNHFVGLALKGLNLILHVNISMAVHQSNVVSGTCPLFWQRQHFQGAVRGRGRKLPKTKIVRKTYMCVFRRLRVNRNIRPKLIFFL